MPHSSDKRVKSKEEARLSASPSFAANARGQREKLRPGAIALCNQNIIVGSETLFGITIFRTIPRETVQELSKRCKWRWFSPGQTILQDQDESREVFFI